MAITITGGKYASAAISSVGTTTLTVSSTPFVSGDFSTQRLVGLWNSSGSTFKGMAYVRRWVSASQLELQTQFFDPATGATVTQVIGDTVLVSKNFSESATTGLATSGSSVSITDGASLTFGTSGVSNSACFYDEGKYISTNAATLFAGGLAAFGKLDDYSSNKLSSPCSWYLTGASANLSMGIRVTSSSANALFYGGQIDGNRANTYYIGGNAANTGGGVSGNTMIFNGVQNCFDFASPGAGGSWSPNASRHQLINCFSQSTATNAILIRWGDGVISGGSYKFPNNTNQPISVFGSDVAGTTNIATPANQRSVVLDIGNGPALVRTAMTGSALTFNFTNLITTDYRFVTGTVAGLSANPQGTNTFSFSDSWTNLQAGSVAVVLNNSGTVVASQASSGTSWAPSLLRRTCVGATVTDNATSWTFGFKKYGYDPYGGAILPTTYSLGTAGSADNVSFGGAVLQSVDAGVTLSQANANALTALSSTNNLYDAVINWSALSVVNAQYPSISSYPVVISGTTVDFESRSLAIDSAAVSAITINTATNLVTAKASTLAGTSKITTISAASISVASSTAVSANLVGAITSAGTLSGRITGNVITTGTLASGVNITGNVTQNTPVNMTGVTINGNLTYNTNSPITITLTGCTITGTISNSGTGIVTIRNSGSSL